MTQDNNSSDNITEAKEKLVTGFIKYKALFLGLERRMQIIIAFGVVMFGFVCCSFSGSSNKDHVLEMLDKLTPVLCEQKQLIAKYEKMKQENPMMELQKDLAYGGSLAALQHLDVDTEEVSELITRMKELRELDRELSGELVLFVDSISKDINVQELIAINNVIKDYKANPCR